MKKSARRTLLGAAICAASIVGAGASTTSAGEITGNGRYIHGTADDPLPGKSICAYSGQNDERQLGDESAPRVQSWGQDVKAAVSAGFPPPGGVPGTACNASGKSACVESEVADRPAIGARGSGSSSAMISIARI